MNDDRKAFLRNLLRQLDQDDLAELVRSPQIASKLAGTLLELPSDPVSPKSGQRTYVAEDPPRRDLFPRRAD